MQPIQLDHEQHFMPCLGEYQQINVMTKILTRFSQFKDYTFSVNQIGIENVFHIMNVLRIKAFIFIR